MTGMFFLILLLVCARLFERAINRSIIPFDPHNRITDWRLPLDRSRDRQPRDVVGKDVTDYDAIADAQLKRLRDHRRKLNPDNGQRRRAGDRG